MKNTDSMIDQKIDKILENITIGFYDKFSKNAQKVNKFQEDAYVLHDDSLLFLYLFLGITCFGVLLFYIIDQELLVIYLAVSAMISLFFALISPLVVTILHSSFPILGEVVLSFEYKSILTTIKKLFDEDNYVLAFIILVFSILIPMVKSIFLLLYGVLKEWHLADRLLFVMEKVGKWSMLDVFIVALIVVFFSSNQDIHSSLKVEVGVYFFIIYVLLSMLGSSVLANKAANKQL